MNRRNFFQKMMAGIGALVGYKYLPKAKTLTKSKVPRLMAFDDFEPEDCSRIDFVQNTFLAEDLAGEWDIATRCENGMMMQCCYKINPDDSILVDWFRCIQLKDNNPNTTIEISMNNYEQFVRELIKKAGGRIK